MDYEYWEEERTEYEHFYSKELESVHFIVDATMDHTPEEYLRFWSLKYMDECVRVVKMENRRPLSDWLESDKHTDTYNFYQPCLGPSIHRNFDEVNVPVDNPYAESNYTNDPDQVTCDKCKKSWDWIEANIQRDTVDG